MKKLKNKVSAFKNPKKKETTVLETLYEIGLQHQFKKNIKLSLQFNDVFNTASLIDYISNVNRIEQNYRQNESSRNFRISLSYDFGNKKVNVKNRAFSNDDEQRRSN